MKKEKKMWLIFLGGLLIGMLIAVGGMTVLHRAGQETAAEEAGQQDSGVAGTEGEEKAGSSEADTWDKSAIYNGGDEVAYHGKIYRAKWWTQGEQPGMADVWEDTLVAAGQSVNTAEGGIVGQMPDGIKGSAAASEKEGDAGTKGTSDKEEKLVKRKDFKVVGYFPSWETDTENIRYDVLTHINYAFAIPTEEGGLFPLENASVAQKIIEEAHQEGVKVFIAVGGWSYHDVPLENTFMAATETAEKREALADALVALCEKYGFDGVDIDWEHPRVDGTSSAQYEGLVLALAGRLHDKGKQLSSAVISGVTADGNVYYDAAAHTDTVLEAVDWLNVMAYDGGDGERHSSYEFAVNSGTYWNKTRGLAAEKVVLGVPFYGRPSWAAYADILAQVPDAWSVDHTAYNGMDVWYNGEATIRKKTDYALEHFGGVMIWEITQDAKGEHSLQTVIGKTVQESRN